MARLPEIGLQPRQGADPSTAVVRPTDFGLGAVAQDAQAWAAEREQSDRLAEDVTAAEDDRYAEGVVQAFSQTFEPTFAGQGAEWTGPGFSRAALATYDVSESPVRRGDGEQRTAGQQAAVERRLDAYRTATGQRAISFEANLNEARLRDQRTAVETANVNRATTGFLQSIAEPLAALDPTSGTYEADVARIYDGALPAALEAVPEHLRPSLQVRLEGERMNRLSQAYDVSQRAHQAVLEAAFQTSSGQLVNAVLTSPQLFEGVEPQVEALVQTAPAAERPGLRRELMGQLAEARIQGLYNMGETDQALEELNSGQYDAVLELSVKARLLGEGERASRGSIVEQLAVQDWIESDLASVAETGQGAGDGYSLEDVERILGPEAAARYARQRREAETLGQAFAGWDGMTTAEIADQVEAMAPVPGSATYAQDQERYEIAMRRFEQVSDQRREDPGGWAQTSDPAVGGLFEAITGEGRTDAQRRDAARTFALASLERQREAGVPAADQRLLATGQAEDIVAAYAGAADRGEGLAQLGGFLSAFQPRAGADARERSAARGRQSMIMRELIVAGADPGDVAAAALLGRDPVAMGLYVRSRSDPPNLDDRQRRAVRAQVTEAMAPLIESRTGQAPPRWMQLAEQAMVVRMAEAARAGGESPEAAARAATRALTGGYVFRGRDSIRIPVSRQSDGGRITEGATAALRAYGQNDGERFYTPPDRGDGLNADQRREAYADHVMSRGRWVTLPDDAGLVLMAPDLNGDWAPALNADGRAIAYDWDQLTAHGRAALGVSGSGLGRIPPPVVRGAQVRPASATGADRGGGGRQPIGVRNNNPGNLRDDGSPWIGRTGVSGGFLTFRTPEHGMRALAIDLLTGYGRGENTLTAIFRQYAPSSENDTAAYIRAVAQRMGVRADQALNLRDEGVLSSLMGAIVRHENGGDFFPLSMILGGARAALQRGR